MATKQIWLNLPIKNILKSVEFYAGIGFELNSHYNNGPESASFLIGDHNFVLMLFIQSQFEVFVNGKIADAHSSNQMLISIDAASKDEVDFLAHKVIAAGGAIFSPPTEMQGWMYGFGFADPDGHKWNVLYMDRSKLSV